MASASEAADRLIATCPGFQPVWRRRLEVHNGVRFGEYVDLGLLAWWVIEQIVGSSSECLPELFAELEALLDSASEDVRNLIVVGFLEDIQLWIVGARREDPSRFDADPIFQYLGPETRREWLELIRTGNRT